MKHYYILLSLLLTTSMSYNMERPPQKIGIDFLQLKTGEFASAQVVINTIDRLDYLRSKHPDIFENLLQNSINNIPLATFQEKVATELKDYGVLHKENHEITNIARHVILATIELATPPSESKFYFPVETPQSTILRTSLVDFVAKHFEKKQLKFDEPLLKT